MSAALPSAAPTGSPAFRRAIRWVSARCLGWFYRETCVLHADRIPADGPVLFIGNHPNDLPDVLLGYQATARPLRYLATISAATSWLSRKTYEWLGVIPVARIRDMRKMQAAGADVVAINRAATDAVAAALAAGEIVGAFPEGGVRDTCALADFKIGVASMILKYIDTGAENDVTVVPFGIQYEAPRHYGSDVCTLIGAPFSVRRWLASQPDAERGAGGLTRAMHAAVSAVTRNAPTWEAAERRDQLVAALAGRRAPRDPVRAAPGFVATATAIAIAESPESIECHAAARALANAVAKAGGIPTSSVDHARLLFALDVHEQAAPVPTIVIWMGLPAALIGWAVHGPLFLIIRWLADRAAKERADVVALRFVPGLYVAAVWYLLLGIAGALALGAIGWSPLWVLPVVMLMPRFGDLAVGWQRWFTAWRIVRRVHQWGTPERMALRDASATLDARWERAAARSA
ncbi:MAG: 1-acyl-sn-glycerol-3-phosphate acyltransferase [Gemmatimonadaceae bacterium]|nr:1-acyl-sn-glycerol-3-phosphate acyltransferase [Gemmatimonadaceae bacterium]